MIFNNKDLIENMCVTKVINTCDSFNAVEKYICDNCEPNEKYFYQFLSEAVASKNIPMTKVVINSGINRNYVYNIINGTKKKPGRDKVIALCIGSEMTVEETCIGLELAGFSRLRGNFKRDILIAFAISQGLNDVFKINIMLEEHNVEPLNI